jgi:hypothetical protein
MAFLPHHQQKFWKCLLILLNSMILNISNSSKNINILIDITLTLRVIFSRSFDSTRRLIVWYYRGLSKHFSVCEKYMARRIKRYFPHPSYYFFLSLEAQKINVCKYTHKWGWGHNRNKSGQEEIMSILLARSFSPNRHLIHTGFFMYIDSLSLLMFFLFRFILLISRRRRTFSYFFLHLSSLNILRFCDNVIL